MYLCLPFDLTSSPWLFANILKPLIAHLRKNGHTVVFYLDDGWQCGNTFQVCLDTCTATYNILVECRFLPNIKKSSLIPSTHVEILGFLVNSLSRTISISNNKTQDCLSLISACLTDTITICFVSQTIGKLISLFCVLPMGSLHFRDLKLCKLCHFNMYTGNWDSPAILNPPGQLNPLWLHNIEGAKNSKLISTPSYTDACNYRWGSFLDGSIANGHFPHKEKALSTNTKEMLAIWYALSSFMFSLAHQHVLIQSNNTTAISYIHDMGWMKSHLYNKIAKDIQTLVHHHNIMLSISHIPSHDNLDSDLALRALNLRTKWELPQIHFRTICKTSHQPLTCLSHTQTMSSHNIAALHKIQNVSTWTHSWKIGIMTSLQCH